MSAGLEKLKNIGVQRIHEDTHIARAHIEAIFQENFEDMHTVQLSGFLSILEREYSIDLSDLKKKAKEYYQEKSSHAKPVKAANVFMLDRKKKKLTLLYAALGVVIFLLFAFLSTKSAKEEIVIQESPVKQVENIISQPQESNESLLQEEQNQTLADENATIIEQIGSAAEQNITKAEEKKEQQEAVPTVAKVQSLSLKIMPKSKVWLGYIDLQTKKKSQVTSLDELSLDPSKEWLLAFGHGNINIEINGVLHEFSTPRNMRFLYKDSELKQIDVEEYKDLNNGKAW